MFLAYIFWVGYSATQKSQTDPLLTSPGLSTELTPDSVGGVVARGDGFRVVEAKRVRAVCEKGRSSTAGWGCGSRATFVPKT